MRRSYSKVLLLILPNTTGTDKLMKYVCGGLAPDLNRQEAPMATLPYYRHSRREGKSGKEISIAYPESHFRP
ncbi:hypothetical protein SK128_001008 [Halocaridina rubra]|uniref:Uncharacterized protein n=1 Tax=Halocaridina rubra TaxID=373956 RepID=A0AAN9A4J4_HALRR